MHWRQVTRAWLIPAHAGKTNEPSGHIATHAAHPRSRGENADSRVGVESLDGSSPLTRGKRCGRCRPGGGPRLIPAHAGKTTPPGRLPGGVWAHPRSRGENMTSSIIPYVYDGSSPLTRGKLAKDKGQTGEIRLIPAHAGKTPLKNQHTRQNAAHPRSRGENELSTSFSLQRSGSSPLTRGKPPPARGPVFSPRLIPAHAGKTTDRRRGKSQQPAHPRSRGENRLVVWENVRGAGSSPLTRGKPRRARPQL